MSGRQGMRIAFFCMESAFSVQPLEALLAAGHDVRFVIRPMGSLESRKEPVFKRHPGFDIAVRRLLGMSTQGDASRDPFAVAARADIPAYLVGNASQPRVVRLLHKHAIDLVVVAFFNQLLAPEVFQAARLGGVNMHPSLLPLYRGPAPLFWMFRDGVIEGGLTVHKLAPGEDDGPILWQTPLPIPLGTPGEEHVDALAQLAGSALVEVVERLGRGQGGGRAQDASAASRAPRPKGADLLVDRSLGARRAFHFVRGVGRWNDVRVPVGDRLVRVVDAVELEEGRRMPGECAQLGDLVHLGCDDGVVTFRARMG